MTNLANLSASALRNLHRAFVLLAFVLGFTPLTCAQLWMPHERHDLDTRWELADSLRGRTFRLTPYKPVYMLPAVWSSSPNYQPYREGRPESQVADSIPLNATELKFQLSFKLKAAQGLFKGKGDLWIGYTQTSRWQVYNSDLSRPFRETNYEPELMFALPTHYRVLGFTGKLLTVGLVHQSNGRSEPLSRSWNRIVAQIGLDRGRTTLLLRPWFRIPESPEVDENPDIENLLGSGELIALHVLKRHLFTVQARLSLLNDPFHGGSIQGEWSYALTEDLKLHLQVFQGYGESMLDYNHEQTTVGVGITLLEWQ
jgi:phospholipase A1